MPRSVERVSAGTCAGHKKRARSCASPGIRALGCPGARRCLDHYGGVGKGSRHAGGIGKNQESDQEIPENFPSCSHPAFPLAPAESGGNLIHALQTGANLMIPPPERGFLTSIPSLRWVDTMRGYDHTLDGLPPMRAVRMLAVIHRTDGNRAFPLPPAALSFYLNQQPAVTPRSARAATSQKPAS